MSRQSIPGVSLAIASGDTVLWSNGYGMSDLENFVPAKSSTVYRLASILKPITAVAILQLVERGKIDLDVPTQTHLSDFPVKPWPITTRQLLGHMGGIRHYRDDTESFDTRHFSSLADAIRTFQSDPLVAEPGSKYSYTTYGFVVLGGILEKAAGTSYMDYLREHVFLRAGMATIQADNVYTMIPSRARGYSKTADGSIHNAALSDTSIRFLVEGWRQPRRIW
jgi:CubicO group peptidase (beta-lactamase class C family)